MRCHLAADLERLYSLLVVKNGYLVAEKYFNEGSVGQKAMIQSATKSIASALEAGKKIPTNPPGNLNGNSRVTLIAGYNGTDL